MLIDVVDDAGVDNVINDVMLLKWIYVYVVVMNGVVS